MLPSLPFFTGAFGVWFMLGLKILAAMGFMTAADFVMLYAS